LFEHISRLTTRNYGSWFLMPSGLAGAFVMPAVQLLATTVVLLVLPRTSCNFVASLQSNFVVNLDFDARKDSNENVDGAEQDNTRIMTFAGGRSKFKCDLPVGANKTRSGGWGPGPEGQGKLGAHLRSAKLASVKGRCWSFQREYWSYEVCVSGKITQYRPGADTRFSLGEHNQDVFPDTLLPNGTLMQQFTGGSDNRSTLVEFTCGVYTPQALTIDEPKPLNYHMLIHGPQFCNWRDKKAAEARDTKNQVFKVSALLEELRAKCVNVTHGWWTYEYCYPHTVRQFHLASNGKTRETEHTLGTINGTSTPKAVGQVNMTMVRVQQGAGTVRERRASPSNHKMLEQFLGGGSVCDETSRSRSTFLHFQCPPNWQQKPETRIVSISEGALCEYEIMIYTTLLCGHPMMLPALPKGKEVIQCHSLPNSA